MTTLASLIERGLLSPGSELVWRRRQLGKTHMARLREDGAIVTEDGSAHKSPSGAARHLNGNKPIDGWNVWVVVASGKRLSEIRELQSN